MPNFADIPRKPNIKMLMIGASGSGKTGALASLAKAGFNLRIIDFDNGLTSLREALQDDKEAMKRITYETCTDKMMSKPNGVVVPVGTPKAWAKALKLMTKWKVDGDDGYDLGSPSTWTNKDILVVDTLTTAGAAAMRRILDLNGRSGEQPWQSDYGTAMRETEAMLELLYSDAIPCNVIINSHITYIGGDEKGIGAKGYPSALGNKLPPKVGCFFDVTLMADTIGAGAGTKRVIRTVPEGLVDVKNPFANAKKSYPLDTGLAEFFEAAGIKPV